MKFTTLAGTVIAALLLVGCETLEKPDENYPLAWPQHFSPLGADCRNIDGTYVNQGIGSAGGKPAGPVLLSDWLLPNYGDDDAAMARRELAHAQIVTLHSDEGALSIASGSTRVEVPYSSCYNGTMSIARLIFTGSGASMIGFMTTDKNALVTKAEDGSLVVRTREETGGMIIIVPFYWPEPTEWARFTPVAR